MWSVRGLLRAGSVLAACTALPAGGSLAAGVAGPRQVAAPVRLPAVAPRALTQAAERPVATAAPGPELFQPIAERDFRVFEPAPAVELDLGLPKGAKTNFGGWIALGYHGGVLD